MLKLLSADEVLAASELCSSSQISVILDSVLK